MSSRAYLLVGFTAEGKARPILCWLFKLPLLLIGGDPPHRTNLVFPVSPKPSNQQFLSQFL